MTLQEELKVYKYILNYLKGKDIWVWMCRPLEDLQYDISHFPRLMSKRPKDLYGKIYWFPLNDKESRINIITNLIKEVENEICQIKSCSNR